MRIHPLITKSEDLKALVDRLSKQPFIAVDTEFMRENTYWPDLCLIQSLLGHSLDKGARFTDWSRRPLDKRQIDYAIADVTHLAAVFPRMVEKLKKTGRGAWLDEEMERLADPSSFAFPPEDAWKRLKLPSRNPAVLGRLKALAAWREVEARSKNLPRGRIIKDDTLSEIVLHPPKTQEDLARIRGLSAGWRNNDIGARLISA